MSETHLHIISFAIPFPANYGGVIDVFYKLKQLHKQGIKIHLHCFEYGRSQAPELNELCQEVKYYQRDLSFFNHFSNAPFIVKSRISNELLENLRKDHHPILFEGLHTCWYLNHPELKDRIKVFRESNIEHDYYKHLAKSERNWPKKVYLYTEALKLKFFEKTVKDSSLMLIVSETDTTHFKKNYPTNNVVYLPSFHPYDSINVKEGKGEYILYHGNLSVPENYRAAEFLIEKVFTDISQPLIIAGLNPPQHLKKLCEEKNNIHLIENPDDAEMLDLIRNAHINLLVTSQPTGLKLKLLNVLHNGRFCLVNKNMLVGTGLDDLCTIADSADQIKKDIQNLFSQEMRMEDLARRKELLHKFSNQKNAEKFCNEVFKFSRNSKH